MWHRCGQPAREERDLMIAANNGYLLAFDNLSGVSFWLSDALCRLARPILLNGIEDVISRPDLADRAGFPNLAANRRGAAAIGGRALARIRYRAPPYPGRSAQPGSAWAADVDGLGLPPRWATSNGRLHGLGQRLRDSALAHRDIRSGL
jgi:hypothetical protein